MGVGEGTYNGTYNGWSNYETWVTNLWLGNDAGEYALLREIATQRLPARHVADQLRDTILDRIPEPFGLFRDLLSHALHRVNWEEIIAGARYAEDFDEDDDDDEEDTE